MSEPTSLLENPITRLTKDLKRAAATLSRDEARYLVDSYYQLQRLRIATSHQARTLAESAEPNSVIVWFAQNAEVLEGQIRRALDSYSDSTVTGRWAKAQVGIGPVIAAGLLAHIELEPWRCAVHRADHKQKPCTPSEPHDGTGCARERIETVGHIWRFGGYDPTLTWGKGERRPWNASLKVLFWKIGESFVKVSGHDNAIYGKLLLERKAYEKHRNDTGQLKDQAAANLTRLKRGDTVTAKANKAGRLSDGHIHARAKRWAVKLFLAHYHHVAYFEQYQKQPPKPYVLTQLQHAHAIEVPGWPF